MICDITNKLQLLINIENIQQFDKIYKFLQNVHVDKFSKLQNINNKIILDLDFTLQKLIYFRDICNIVGHLILSVNTNNTNIFSIEIKTTNITLFNTDLTNTRMSDNLYIKVPVKHIEQLYQITKLNSIQSISYLRESVIKDPPIIENYSSDTEILNPRHVMYGWKPMSDRINSDSLHEYLPPNLLEINNFITERQKKYWLCVYDDGLVISRKLNKFVEKNYQNKNQTVNNINSSINHLSENFYDDFKNNDRNTQFTTDTREIITVVAGKKPDNYIYFTSFKDSSDLAHEQYKNYKLLHDEIYDYQGSNKMTLKGFEYGTTDKFGDHGTPVASCAAGYKHGISPNVNILAFTTGGYSKSPIYYLNPKNQLNIPDWLKSDYNIITKLSSNLDYDHIISIANSYANSVMPGIDNLKETIKNNNHLRSSNIIDDNDINDKILCKSSGNDNYDCDDDRLVYVPYNYSTCPHPKNRQNYNNQLFNNINVVSTSQQFTTNDDLILQYGVSKTINGIDSKFYGGHDLSPSGNFMYGALNSYDLFEVNHKTNYQLTIGAFHSKNNYITSYSTGGSPSHFNQVDLVAPSGILACERNGNSSKVHGTSFSAPCISGLSILVRCLVDYFVEQHNYPSYLQTNDMIINLIRESSIKIKNNNNKFYSSFTQGRGVPCLYNVYVYLRDNHKQNFINPLVGLPELLPKCSSDQILKQSQQTCNTINKDKHCSSLSNECPITCGICTIDEQQNNDILQTIGQDYIETENECHTYNTDTVQYFNLDQNECKDYAHFNASKYMYDNKGSDDICYKTNDSIITSGSDIEDASNMYVCKKVHVKNSTSYPPCYLRNQYQDLNDNIKIQDINLSNTNHHILDQNGRKLDDNHYSDNFFNTCKSSTLNIDINKDQKINKNDVTQLISDIINKKTKLNIIHVTQLINKTK